MVELLLAIAAVGGALAAVLGGYAAVIGARTHRAQEVFKKEQKAQSELIIRVVHATNGMSARLEELAFQAGERAEKARHTD